MVHIAIPDVEEMVEVKGERSNQPLKYISYNIAINGVYHCSVRYSAFRDLHDKLKKEFGAGCLEEFPSRTFFYVKPDETAERKFLLQRYLQRIAQQPRIFEGPTFQNFLLNAQKEVQRGPEEDAQLEILLMNGKSVSVDVVSTDQTDDVLETVIATLQMDPLLTYYFGLFLVDDPEGVTVIRRLQEFESPFISLKRAAPHQKIMLRKAYWDPALDGVMVNDPTALNLVYIEAIAKIKHQQILVAPEAQESLSDARTRKDQAGFLAIARRQKYYQYATIGAIKINYPQESTEATCLLGDNRLVLLGKMNEETVYDIGRMKSWRTFNTDNGVELEIEFCFEANKMVWLKIFSAHTIHIAMCMQSMVEEMLRLRDNKRIKIPSDREGKFKPRRQKNKVDFAFLTSDNSSNPESLSKPIEPGLLESMNITKPKLKKQLSVGFNELKAKAQESDEEDD